MAEQTLNESEVLRVENYNGKVRTVALLKPNEGFKTLEEAIKGAEDLELDVVDISVINIDHYRAPHMSEPKAAVILAKNLSKYKESKFGDGIIIKDKDVIFYNYHLYLVREFWDDNPSNKGFVYRL